MTWEEIRSQLHEQLGKPEEFDRLLRLASQTNVDIHLRVEALDLAQRIVDEIEPPMRRTIFVSKLLPRLRKAQNGLTEEQFKKARDLLFEIRENRPEHATSLDRKSWNSGVSVFETDLIAEWAHRDYSAATAYMETLDPLDSYHAYHRTALALAGRD